MERDEESKMELAPFVDLMDTVLDRFLRHDIDCYLQEPRVNYTWDEDTESLAMKTIDWSEIEGSTIVSGSRVRGRYNDKRVKPSRRNNYPRTAQLGFIDHLVQSLVELLKHKADSVGPSKPYILRVQKKLKFMSRRLSEIPELRKEEADLADLSEGITNLAYEVEYLIDSFLVGDIPMPQCMSRLCDILKDLGNYERQVQTQSGDVRSIVTNIVISSLEELDVIPVVKRTKISTEELNQVFDDPEIYQSFDIRTRALVSSYKEKRIEVFRELLDNLTRKGYQHKQYLPRRLERVKRVYTNDASTNRLEEMLCELLKNKRYFIILEDVQDIDVLNDIRRFLPNESTGSRVLLTTPSPELAVQCRYDSQDLIKMSVDRASTVRINKATIDDIVVGFKVETERMLELLIGGPEKLWLISIFGMPGQGKTTLAMKLYSNLSVVDYFHTRAWCCVSEAYEKRELLLVLLGQIVQLSDTIRNKNDVELAEILYKSLKGRRFLILLDDVWKSDAWNDLARCFPNDNNGSRIIITTRMQKLASQAKSDCILQSVCLLSQDESWELLQKKVFLKERCPPELLEVGRQIAKNCRGLPLSVVLTAGLLVKLEKKVYEWEHIAKTLSSHILGNAGTQGMGVIGLSYKHLPDYLKPCFLYFGAFLEDMEVPVWKLICLWISEGYIKHSHLKSLEDVAEDYLKELIDRSLVTVVREKSKGGVKSCRVHDLLREFCVSKAREENFLQQIHGYDEYFLPSDDKLDYGMDPDRSYSSTPVIYHLRRLCIYSKRNHFIRLKPSGPFVRSLLFFAASDMCPSYSYDVSSIFHNFRFLRILKFEDINIGDSFKDIGSLVLLRYLSVQISVDSIPSSIANLWNLETFHVKGLSGKIVKVPNSIWDMAMLRHVCITDSASFDLELHRLESSSILDNLQTFSTPSLSYGDDMEKVMRKLPGLRKLKCTFLDSWDDARNCNQLPELGFLTELVSLKVFYNGEGKYPCKFNFPSNLTKLTLSNFRMHWNETAQLSQLCNLEVLKILCNAFEGERWDMELEVFQKLKFLKLDSLNFVEWSAFPENFPCLERLLLHKCDKLEEIPLSIGDIPTLQLIEVMWCSPTTAISARKIQEEQLEFGNEALKIHVRPKVWDPESSSGSS